MASSYKMELDSFEEEQLMDSVDKDGDSDSDLTSLPDSDISAPKGRKASAYEDEDGLAVRSTATETAEDFATLISTKDDPALNPWTFRTWFVGIGLSTFGASMGTMYFFKPSAGGISNIFLGVISYIIGEGLSHILPRRGYIGKILNPHPFNRKEHVAILIMASTASAAPQAIEIISIERLYYKRTISPLVSIFCIISSQFIGYGIGGLLRRTLLYPTKMLYPICLPLVTLIEVLNGAKSAVQKKLRVFWIAFIVVFLWEPFPQYMMPILLGVSVFCLANQNSLPFTNIFGGSNANEGLGVLSLCFDMQYISTTGLWYPFPTQINLFIGYVCGILLVIGVYYGNVWNSLKFPFTGQALFTEQSTAANYVQFNQTSILNKSNVVDESLLAKQGLPYFTGAFVITLITSNAAVTATFTHLFLFNYNEIKSAWSFVSRLKRFIKNSNRSLRFWENSTDSRPTDTTDPHVRLMLKYKDVPDWWYGLIFVVAVLLGIIICYAADTALPWWGFIVAMALSFNNILFFGAQYALTAWKINTQAMIQLTAAYMFPGRPITNMYFTLFGYQSVGQGFLLLRDLKMAQYAHLSPRCAFTMITTGTIVGAMASYVVMNTIISNQEAHILGLEGTNAWSGQIIQQINSQAVAYGALASKLFSPGARYQWVNLAFVVGFLAPVPFYLVRKRWRKLAVLNTPIVLHNMGSLNSGINSSVFGFFISGFISQFWLRKYHPVWFKKYNYILSAGLDGGCQVMVFILTFTVMGGAGKAVAFPKWWGNNADGNYDLCKKNPALKG